MRSRGTACVPFGHCPLSAGNTMCVRWLALSVSFPFQQLGNSRTRRTPPPGQIGYLVVTRLSKPRHVHCARALVGPLVPAFASPVIARMKRGIGTTLAWALPRKSSCTETGRRILPSLPSTPPPPAFASAPTASRRRRTGQKYADRSPSRQVVSPAARLSLVEKALVVTFPT